MPVIKGILARARLLVGGHDLPSAYGPLNATCFDQGLALVPAADVEISGPTIRRSLEQIPIRAGRAGFVSDPLSPKAAAGAGSAMSWFRMS